MTAAEQFTDPLAVHGEGPVWSAAWNALCWVDLLAGDVLSVPTDGAGDPEPRRWHVGQRAAALRPRAGGGLIVATEHDFLLADAIGGPTRRLAGITADPAVRFNDGACDPQGRFLCGTMAYDETPGAGVLYRVDAAGRVSTVLSGLTISNGLAWTADGGSARYVDTPTGRIDELVLSAPGEVTDRRSFVTVDEAAGFPDGLTVDADGGVWVALWGGGAVRRYGRSGELTDVVEVGARNVTACTLGGADRRDLFITTSREGDDAPSAAAGAVFRQRVDVPGFEPYAFAG